MVKIHATLRSGETRTLTAMPGWSLMETLRDNGVDEVLAICGGSCSCATCHVYINPEDLNRLPPAQSDERDLLGCSDHQTDQSRLSCQIRITPDLDQLRLTIAPEE